jgi:hypothetical protein
MTRPAARPRRQCPVCCNPYYGDSFRRIAPSRWVSMLERLGAFAAAAAEEAAGRLPPPRSPEPQERAARSEDA